MALRDVGTLRIKALDILLEREGPYQTPREKVLAILDAVDRHLKQAWDAAVADARAPAPPDSREPVPPHDFEHGPDLRCVTCGKPDDECEGGGTGRSPGGPLTAGGGK